MQMQFASSEGENSNFYHATSDISMSYPLWQLAFEHSMFELEGKRGFAMDG